MTLHKISLRYIFNGEVRRLLGEFQNCRFGNLFRFFGGTFERLNIGGWMGFEERNRWICFPCMRKAHEQSWAGFFLILTGPVLTFVAHSPFNTNTFVPGSLHARNLTRSFIYTRRWRTSIRHLKFRWKKFSVIEEVKTFDYWLAFAIYEMPSKGTWRRDRASGISTNHLMRRNYRRKKLA